jgi:hypothetical protein
MRQSTKLPRENIMNEIDLLIRHAISTTHQIRKAKNSDQKQIFEDWTMPSPPERFIKHKKNDPL